MAVTPSNKTQSVFGDQKVLFATITGPVSYTTGGETFDAGSSGLLSELSQIDHVVVSAVDEAGANTAAWDRSAGTIIYFVASTAVEVASTTDLSAVLHEVFVIGK